MKNKNLSKKILDSTLGIFATIGDLILFFLAINIEIGLHPSDAHSIYKLQKRLDRLHLKGTDRIIRNAIYQARHKDWLDENLNLTDEGWKRLKNSFPTLLAQKSWDGKWYLSIFDIPEKIRRKRDILRENLKILGFGQLQASVWVSAVNYLKNVEEIVEKYQLTPYVILTETERIGREDSQTLADKVWKLKKLNEEYRNLLKEWEKGNEEERFWLKFRYFDILRRDPQLPRELLSEDWQGFKAYKILHRFSQYFHS